MIPLDRIPEGAEAYCQAAAEREQALIAAFPPALRTLPAILKRQAALYGDRKLFVAGDESLSFAEAPERAARWAGMLARQGIEKGDRVALLCGNRAAFLDIVLGSAWMGAIFVPINTASRGFQLQHILNNSGAKALFIEDTLIEALDTIDRDALALQSVFVIGALPPRDDVLPLPAPADPVPAADLAMSDTLAILYTSGTTGLSKGVCCPHGQYFWWGVYTGRQIGVRDGDVLHTTLPLFHTNAFNCFFQALLHGATQVVEIRFSVSQFWERLNASGATVTYLLGAMVPMLLSRDPTGAEKSHKVRVALSPAVPEHFHAPFTDRTGILLLDGYGATESNAVIGTEVATLNPGTMGRIAEGFQARVVDDQDCDLPDGTAGELILRADEPFAMSTGYFGMADKTVESWRNLWLHTGDRVVRQPDGYFRFVDRMKDAIRRRGENISSYEVEQVVLSHPAVAVAAAYPVSSDLAEDEVMVALVLKENAGFDPVDLIRHCESRMPYFAIPRYIDVIADMPRTESGKIQKFRLRDEGITATAWDREAAGITVKR